METQAYTSAPPKEIKAKVVGRRPLKKGYFLLRLETPLLGLALPGQFIMLRPPGADPLLPRPFSIHDQEGPYIDLLIQVRGRFTRYLSQVGKGEVFQLVGPLGKGFPELESQAILVAGGIGVAPFGLWLKRFGPAPLIYGARKKDDLVRLSFFKRLSAPLILTTEDGSQGRKALVTGPLEELLQQRPSWVLACGPLPMLAAVARLAEKTSTKVLLSLEAQMACGTGLCLGCVVKKKNGGYLHVCKEGPVVLAEEVAFD
ncbi:dihydroorotate dehydrogenase electron transfer subunit [Thermosulfuriphilus sp.]